MLLCSVIVFYKFPFLVKMVLRSQCIAWKFNIPASFPIPICTPASKKAQFTKIIVFAPTWTTSLRWQTGYLEFVAVTRFFSYTFVGICISRGWNLWIAWKIVHVDSPLLKLVNSRVFMNLNFTDYAFY